ncbi:MAG TPA: hypothetical protein VMB34_06805 [Acetobacteraceae bacterium]|nr:hypothetical protein [Acetobacteraceae bacterium]
MMLTWMAAFRHDGAVSDADLHWLGQVLRSTPGAVRRLVYTPAQTHDPYLDDGRPPALVLQLYFDDVAALEAALDRGGALQILAAPNALGSLRGATVMQQAMLARAFPVPDAGAPASSRCAYLVTYEGAAEDLNTWTSHYVASHTAVMARFPGIREIEVCTRLDWCGFLPWPRADAMLRNKVVFDDAVALTAALNSPVRHEMREDYGQFPPFSGGVTHFPMLAREIAPAPG